MAVRQMENMSAPPRLIKGNGITGIEQCPCFQSGLRGCRSRGELEAVEDARYSKTMTSGEAQMRKMKKKSVMKYPLWRRRQLLTLRVVFGVMMSVCVCVDVCMCVCVCVCVFVCLLFRAERGRELTCKATGESTRKRHGSQRGQRSTFLIPFSRTMKHSTPSSR